MADWLHPADREPREYRSSPPHIFVSNAFEATFSTVNFFNKQRKQWDKMETHASSSSYLSIAPLDPCRTCSTADISVSNGDDNAYSKDIFTPGKK